MSYQQEIVQGYFFRPTQSGLYELLTLNQCLSRVTAVRISIKLCNHLRYSRVWRTCIGQCPRKYVIIRKHVKSKTSANLVTFRSRRSTCKDVGLQNSTG